ncbi:FTSH1, partial [Symbiodinium necroappetens]
VPTHAGESHAAPSYHTNVKLADGEEWLCDAASKLGQEPALIPRAANLSVGGVGKGAQTCRNDCRMPMTLTRADGSRAVGSFSGPVVQGSGCPALLGLKSLQENRALLDLDKGLMRFLGEGEATLVLPPGSETFRLEAAKSGHLLLPIDPVPAGAPPGEHHLFIDNAVPQNCREPSSDLAEHHMSTEMREQIQHSEQLCAEVLQSFSVDSAKQCVCKIAERWQSVVTPSQPQRFDSPGASSCFGLYVHGGQHGITCATRDQPQLAKVLCALMNSLSPDTPYTTLMLSADVVSPVHVDKFNEGINTVLPLHLPAHGGGLWLELRLGDRPSMLPKVGAEAIECANTANTSFTTSASATTNANTSFTTSASATTNADTSFTTSTSATTNADTSFTTPSSSFSSETQPKRTPSPRAADAKPMSKGKHPPVRVGFVKRVLLITLFQSTVAAFMSQQWEAMRLRPLELVRDGYDHALAGLKQRQYQAVWIDLASPQHFAGRGDQDRMSRVMARLATLIDWAVRLEVPAFISSGRRMYAQHESVQHLLQLRQYHISYHNWCHWGVKLNPNITASAAKLKLYSTIPFANHECTCAPGTAHDYDLDANKGAAGSAAAPSRAEEAAMKPIVAALSAALCSSESVKLADPMCSSHACPDGSLSASSRDQAYPVAAVKAELPVNSPANDVTVTGLSPHTAAEPCAPQVAYPTDQKIRQRQHVQDMKAQGKEVHVRKKTHVVEQHADDCGESLASLMSAGAAASSHFAFSSSDNSDDDLSDFVDAITSSQLNSFALWVNEWVRVQLAA